MQNIDHRIAKLKKKSKALEQQLSANFNDLKENYVSMAAGSIFNRPHHEPQGGKVLTKVAEVIMNSPKVQHLFETMADKLAGKAADKVDEWIDKFNASKD